MPGAGNGVPAAAFRGAREALRLDSSGRPRCPDSREVLRALCLIAAMGSEDAVDEIVQNGFLATSERYGARAAAAAVGGSYHHARYAGAIPYFQGESPPHRVTLSAFAVSAVPVTERPVRTVRPQPRPAARRGRSPGRGCHVVRRRPVRRSPAVYCPPRRSGSTCAAAARRRSGAAPGPTCPATRGTARTRPERSTRRIPRDARRERVRPFRLPRARLGMVPRRLRRGLLRTCAGPGSGQPRPASRAACGVSRGE